MYTTCVLLETALRIYRHCVVIENSRRKFSFRNSGATVLLVYRLPHVL
jgi:hypothetical protein